MNNSSHIIRIVIAVLLVVVLGIFGVRFMQKTNHQAQEKLVKEQVKELETLFAEAGKAYQDRNTAAVGESLQKIEALLQKIKTPGVKLKNAPVMIDLYSRIGQREKAETLLDEYVKTVDASIPLAKDLEENVFLQRCLTYSFQMYLKLGKQQKAQTVLQKFEKYDTSSYPPATKIRTMMDTANGYAYLNQPENAVKFMEKAESAAAGISEGERAAVLLDISRLFLGLHRFDDSLAYAAKAEDLLKKIDIPERSQMLRDIADIRNVVHKALTGEEPPKKTVENFSVDDL